MCINILAMIAGYNLDNVDAARLPIYLNYTPSGTSVANMAHWCQVRGLGQVPLPWNVLGVFLLIAAGILDCCWRVACPVPDHFKPL